MILLLNKTLILLEGKDNISFLQRIVTQDVSLLTEQKQNTALYSLILSPQGKLLYDIFIYLDQDKVLLECHNNFVNDIIVLLNKYKMRSKVVISTDDKKVAITETKNSDKEKRYFFDSRNSQLPLRVILKDSIICQDKANDEVSVPFYLNKLYNLSLPTIVHDFLPLEFFPFDLGLHHHNSISYSKGCYIGQEVITRAINRGVIRKKLCKVKIDNKNNLITRGTDIISQNKKVGSILGNYCFEKYFAVMRNFDDTTKDKEIFTVNDNIVVKIEEANNQN